MRRALSVAIVLLSACALRAQIIGRVNRLADGSEQLAIHNNSRNTLVAFVLSVKHVSPDSAPDVDSLRGPLVIFSDSLIDGPAAPLQAGEQRTITRPFLGLPPGSFRNGTHLLEDSILTAGIYSGGTTSGDQILLGRLILRRSNMLQAVETSAAALSNAGGHNIPRSQLIEQFQTLADSLNHWYLPPEQQIGRDLYQSIVGRLLNLPEPQFGAPFPPSDFVRQQLSNLNQLRVRLLASEPNLHEAVVLIGR